MESVGDEAYASGEQADGELDCGVGDVEGEEEREAPHVAGGEPSGSDARGASLEEGGGHGDGGVGAREAGRGRERRRDGELTGVGEAAVPAADDAVVGVPRLGIRHYHLPRRAWSWRRDESKKKNEIGRAHV